MVKNNKSKKLAYIIPAAICAFFALFFKYGIVGHGMIALVFAGVGFVFASYLILSLLAKRYKKLTRILRTTLAGLILLGITAFTIAEIPVIKGSNTDMDPKADYLIVLGAGVNGTVPSLSLANRLDAAYKYMIEYPDSIAVVSGGQGPGEDITEAEAMYIYLTDAGISLDRIIKEEKSTSTEENITFSLEKIYEENGTFEGDIAIVTSEYHLYRAKNIAGRLGIEPIGVAAETTLPTLKLNHFIREAFGVILMFFGVK